MTYLVNQAVREFLNQMEENHDEQERKVPVSKTHS